METKKIERVSYDEVYVAVDGTEFNDREECKKYEHSALGVILGKLHKMAIKEASECDMFSGSGSEENKSYLVVPKNESDVTTIQHALFAANAYKAEDAAEKVAENIGRPILVTFGYHNDGCWITSLDKMIEFITSGKYKVVENEDVEG